MKEKATIERGEKKFILKDGTESALNQFIDCRDGIIYKREYMDCSGYGSLTTAYYCKNTKHESVAIIIHTYEDRFRASDTGIYEKALFFDSDSWREIEKLLKLDAELYRTY